MRNITTSSDGKDLRKNLGAYFREVFRTDGLKHVSKNIVKCHNFILIRYVSIKYPMVANAFNTNKIDQYAASMYLHRMMANMYTRVPQWLWIKYDKSKSDLYKKLDRQKKSIVYYMDINMMGTASFYYMCRNNPEKLLEDLKLCGKLIKENDIEIKGSFKIDPNLLN